MTNLERIKMEILDISYTDEQLTVFLLENGLSDTDEYNWIFRCNLTSKSDSN